MFGALDGVVYILCDKKVEVMADYVLFVVVKNGEGGE